jgi:hypothetical protein
MLLKTENFRNYPKNIFVYLLAIVVILNCKIKKTSLATLEIETIPTSVKIWLNGELIGKTPLTIELDVNKKFNLSFQPLPGFIKPLPISSIKVLPAKKILIKREYIKWENLFPGPNDLTPQGKLKLYGSPDRKERDGDIFDFINGAGRAYLKYGFETVGFLVYLNEAKEKIEVEIYNMGNPENARKIFEDPDIVFRPYYKLKLGEEGGIYKELLLENIIYFYQERFLCSLTLSKEEKCNLQGLALAQEISNLITSQLKKQRGKN